MSTELSGKEIEQMRQNFRSWLLYLLQVHGAEFPTQRALARALGLSDASITYYLQGARSPSVETAVAVSRLVEHPVDYMLFHPPPAVRPAAKR